MFVQLLQQRPSAIQSIESDVSRQRWQPGLASRHDFVVVSVLVVHDGVAGVFRTDGENWIVLGPKVTAVGTRPPQSLAIPGHGGQHDVTRQVVSPTDAEVLAYRAHAGMIVRLG